MACHHHGSVLAGQFLQYPVKRIGLHAGVELPFVPDIPSRIAKTPCTDPYGLAGPNSRSGDNQIRNDLDLDHFAADSAGVILNTTTLVFVVKTDTIIDEDPDYNAEEAEQELNNMTEEELTDKVLSRQISAMFGGMDKEK